MNKQDRMQRIDSIVSKLRRGDRAEIRRRYGYSYTWMQKVLNYRTEMSEPLLRDAESLIAERAKSQTN